MISKSVEFRDFNGTRYHNLEGLFRGDLARTDSAQEARAPGVGPRGLLVLKRRGRVVKVRHTHLGRLDPEGLGDLSSLADAAARHGARWIAVADGEALEEINEAASATLRVGHDMVDLALALLGEFETQIEKGRVSIWPNLFEGVRLPSRNALRRLFDVVLPPGTTFLLYIFDGEALWAEIICARGEHQIMVIAGHDALECGPPPWRWRDEYKMLLTASAERFGPPALGIFLSLDAAREILSGSWGGGELPKALARKELIFDPLPPWLAGPLGVMAIRDAVQVGRKARGRLVDKVAPRGMGARLAGRVAGRVADKVKSSIGDRLRNAVPLDRVEQTVNKLRSKADLGEILGFDPFVLAGNLLELARPQHEESREEMSAADDS